MTETHERLLVRFNDEEYYPAEVARINYDNGDYFSIKWDAPDDVKIDYKFAFIGVTNKPIEKA
ncbi:MAG: hypothetical protein DLM72_10070 [Candidatus Nitrosopolaris wilkensis]|nr:MAG: hypothetical protein DLM72_10070 [Candidatus Nitrosopolaris wilkensis]